MKRPANNAPAEEIIDFLSSYNFKIHNTILEGGDYFTLIDELIDAELGNNCYGYVDAMTALHVSKTRIYADKRDVTHEANHVYKEMSVCKDLGSLMVEAEENERGNQEYALEFMEDKEKFKASTASVGASIQHLLMLETLYEFPINAKSPVKGTVLDLRKHIKKMETTYLDTASAIYLPLDVLTSAERNILRTTSSTEEVELLISKIYENWDKRKNGMVNSIPSARLVSCHSQYTINRHLETIGTYRRQYHRFVKEQTLPTKKLALGMALYFAPNDFETIEQFMNAFGYSLKSNIMAVSEENIATTKNVVLLDRDIRKILNSGLDTDLILMLLAEKSRKVKKSASSKNFS